MILHGHFVISGSSLSCVGWFAALLCPVHLLGQGRMLLRGLQQLPTLISNQLGKCFSIVFGALISFLVDPGRYTRLEDLVVARVAIFFISSRPAVLSDDIRHVHGNKTPFFAVHFVFCWTSADASDRANVTNLYGKSSVCNRFIHKLFFDHLELWVVGAGNKSKSGFGIPGSIHNRAHGIPCLVGNRSDKGNVPVVHGERLKLEIQFPIIVIQEDADLIDAKCVADHDISLANIGAGRKRTLIPVLIEEMLLGIMLGLSRRIEIGCQTIQGRSSLILMI